MKTQSLTKITLLTIFAMSVITAVTLNSCQKEIVKPKPISKTSSAAATDPTVSSAQVLNEITSMVFASSRAKNEKGLGQNLNLHDTTGGVIVTTDTFDKPHSVTYNYGTGCTGSDGLTRSGVVTITYDNEDIRVVNNVYAITLQNYTVSGFQVTNLNGTMSYANTGTNANGNLVIAQTGGYIGNSGPLTDTINVGYQYEWIAGESSSPLANLQFKVTGATYGYANGNTAIDSITSPLTKNCKYAGCNFFIQGTRYSEINGSQVKLTNYGNPGGCSGQMTVTVNGITSIENQ
jgi:hypothetical protein